MILAIETSTPVCSVALKPNSRSVWEKRMEGRGVHSERLFTFTEELLNRAGAGIADLDAVLFSRGPGSYTGLRIGASAIKGFLYKRNVPFFTFPTLLSFAAGLTLGANPQTIYSVIDARRQHLYLQRLDWDGKKLIQTDKAAVTSINEIEREIMDRLQEDVKFGPIVVGTGWERLSIEQELTKYDPDIVSDKDGTKARVFTFGTERITAKSLIKAWETPSLKESFLAEDPRQFDPDYLEIAQVNNTKL